MELHLTAEECCHMGSPSVKCHPTQVNTPRLNSSYIGRYTRFTYTAEGWKAELT